jgi:hypothetical protein
MRKRPGEVDPHAERPGLGFEGRLQRALADEHKGDGGELGSRERFDEEVEPVPFNKPAGEAQQEGWGLKAEG